MSLIVTMCAGKGCLKNPKKSMKCWNIARCRILKNLQMDLSAIKQSYFNTFTVK